MGLDMYLSNKRYLSKHFDPVDSERIEKINDAFGIEGDEDGDYGAQEVTFRVAYWRKANAIHKWFVDNVQEGEDECREHYVSREQLEALRDACIEAVADPDNAGDWLCPTEGFFFGSTEIDEWYFDALKETIKQLNACLKMDKAWSFYYCSSW